jgi:hypothetical protein
VRDDYNLELAKEEREEMEVRVLPHDASTMYNEVQDVR